MKKNLKSTNFADLVKNLDDTAENLSPSGNYHVSEILREAAEAIRTLLAPVDMILHCPACGAQHVDRADLEGETSVEMNGRETRWDNPPHKSHLCHCCNTVWRPSDRPTNGVAKIETAGERDSYEYGGGFAANQPMASIEEFGILANYIAADLTGGFETYGGAGLVKLHKAFASARARKTEIPAEHQETLTRHIQMVGRTHRFGAENRPDPVIIDVVAATELVTSWAMDARTNIEVSEATGFAAPMNRRIEYLCNLVATLQEKALTKSDLAEVRALLHAYDQAMENQKESASDAKLIVMANYGDLAINALRAVERKNQPKSGDDNLTGEQILEELTAEAQKLKLGY